MHDCYKKTSWEINANNVILTALGNIGPPLGKLGSHFSGGDKIEARGVRADPPAPLL